MFVYKKVEMSEEEKAEILDFVQNNPETVAESGSVFAQRYDRKTTRRGKNKIMTETWASKTHIYVYQENVIECTEV